jgi:hypothetical protein
MSTPNADDINEYIPTSCISLFVPSQMIRNVYIMTKLIAEKDWCDSGNLEFDLDAEWANYKSTSYNPYGAVSNTPSTEYLNYSQYANYPGNSNRSYQAGNSAAYGQQYPNLNSFFPNDREGNILFLY